MAHHTSHSPHDTVHYEQDLHEHDSWFRHSPDEPHHQQAHGETHAWAIVAFMVGTLAAVVVICFVVYWFMFEPLMRRESELVREGRAISAEFSNSRTEWERQLRSFDWTDPAAGRIRIPLEIAKQRVIAEYAAQSKKSK